MRRSKMVPIVKATWVSFLTILRKEITRYMRIWVQTLFPPVITTTLYFLIFGNLIGNRIGEMDGHPYIQFIVPGLILMSVISNSYMNTSSSFYSAKFQGFIEEVLVSPTPNWVILTGWVLGGVSRGLLIGVIVSIVATFFTDLPVAHPFLAIVTAFLTAVLFSIAGFINGAFARSFDDVSIVPTFVLTPLTYLGGIFYSVSLLPEFWQKVSLFNPILYMINGFRYGILGTSDIPYGWCITVIIIMTGLLTLIALSILHKGLGVRT